MKISLDIDCTPDELRGFFGMPEIQPMQERLLKEVEERMRANLIALDPEAMLKTWLPAGLKGFEQMQEMFFSQMAREEIAMATALRTPRLWLPEWRDDDAAAFAAMLADPALTRAAPTAPPRPPPASK